MGGFVEQNQNPKRRNVGDCTVRALSLATGKSWDRIYYFCKED